MASKTVPLNNCDINTKLVNKPKQQKQLKQKFTIMSFDLQIFLILNKMWNKPPFDKLNTDKNKPVKIINNK